MPSTTPLQGIPIPSGGDAPSSVAAFATGFGAVEAKLVMRYASAAARDTALPVAARKGGMVSSVGGGGALQWMPADGGAWVSLAAVETFKGGGGFMVGAAAPAGALKIVFEDSVYVTLNSAGAFTHLFGGMPNGIVTAFYMVGESPQTGVYLTTSASTLSSITGSVIAFGGGAAGAGGCRLNFRIVGW